MVVLVVVITLEGKLGDKHLKERRDEDCKGQRG